jgi:hypothetical protein
MSRGDLALIEKARAFVKEATGQAFTAAGELEARVIIDALADALESALDRIDEIGESSS